MRLTRRVRWGAPRAAAGNQSGWPVRTNGFVPVARGRPQIDGTEWSWSNLNKLCWAIGSISGAMGMVVRFPVRLSMLGCVHRRAR